MTTIMFLVYYKMLHVLIERMLCNVGYNVFSLLFVSLFFAFRTIQKISPQNERCYHGNTFDYVVQNIT